MTNCDCRHEREGRCTLMPKVLVTAQEWQDSGHPMLPDYLATTARWEHPPADAPCGQQAPREAVPAKPYHGGCDHSERPTSSLRNGVCWICGRDMREPTPPAAAPAPSEAAKQWANEMRRCITQYPGNQWAPGTGVSEGLALIAAAEQRAESAERGLKVMRDTNANVAKCGGEYMKEAFDLRAKLAAATIDRDASAKLANDVLAAAKKTGAENESLRHQLAAAERDLFAARNDLLREGMERDAARGRAVEALRELDNAALFTFAGIHPAQTQRFRKMIADKIAAEQEHDDG